MRRYKIVKVYTKAYSKKYLIPEHPIIKTDFEGTRYKVIKSKYYRYKKIPAHIQKRRVNYKRFKKTHTYDKNKKYWIKNETIVKKGLIVQLFIMKTASYYRITYNFTKIHNRFYKSQIKYYTDLRTLGLNENVNTIRLTSHIGLDYPLEILAKNNLTDKTIIKKEMMIRDEYKNYELQTSYEDTLVMLKIFADFIVKNAHLHRY